MLSKNKLNILIDNILVTKKENIRKVLMEIIEEEELTSYSGSITLDLLLGDKKFRTPDLIRLPLIKDNLGQLFPDPSLVDHDSVRILTVNNVKQHIVIGYKNVGHDYEYNCYLSFTSYDSMLPKANES